MSEWSGTWPISLVLLQWSWTLRKLHIVKSNSVTGVKDWHLMVQFLSWWWEFNRLPSLWRPGGATGSSGNFPFCVCVRVSGLFPLLNSDWIKWVVFDRLVFPSLSLSLQAGTSTTVFRALEIPRSLGTRCKQAHHAQPADEGQRSHQGTCMHVCSRPKWRGWSDRGVLEKPPRKHTAAFLTDCCDFPLPLPLQRLEESDRRAQHTVEQLQREQRHLRRRLEQLGVERTRMDSTGSTVSDKSESDQGESHVGPQQQHLSAPVCLLCIYSNCVIIWRDRFVHSFLCFTSVVYL